MADGYSRIIYERARRHRSWKPETSYKRAQYGKSGGIAPSRAHSIMVIRCPWGDVTLKPWSPK